MSRFNLDKWKDFLTFLLFLFLTFLNVKKSIWINEFMDLRIYWFTDLCLIDLRTNGATDGWKVWIYGFIDSKNYKTDGSYGRSKGINQFSAVENQVRTSSEVVFVRDGIHDSVVNYNSTRRVSFDCAWIPFPWVSPNVNPNE